MERKTYIDISKGGAILLVVVGHLVQNNLTGSTAKALFDFIYSFHMPLFMFLSGYVASLTVERNLEEGRNFIAKKARSLLLPFMSWGGVNMLVRHSISLEDLKQLILFPDNGLWFLPVLFCIQITYWTVMFVARKKVRTRGRSLICEVIASILAIAVVFALNKHNGVCSNLYFNYNLYAMFFLGSLVAAHLEKWLMHDVVPLVSVAVFFLLVPHFHMWGKNPSTLIIAISLSASVIMLHFSRAMVSCVPEGNRLVQFGKFSMTIYAAHFYLVQVVHGIKLDVTHMAFLPTFVILMLVAFMICRVCVVFGQVVGHSKILNTLLLGAKHKS